MFLLTCERLSAEAQHQKRQKLKNGCNYKQRDDTQELLLLLPHSHNRSDCWSFSFPSLEKEIRCTEQHRKIITALFHLDSGCSRHLWGRISFQTFIGKQFFLMFSVFKFEKLSHVVTFYWSYIIESVRSFQCCNIQLLLLLLVKASCLRGCWCVTGTVQAG